MAKASGPPAHPFELADFRGLDVAIDTRDLRASCSLGLELMALGGNEVIIRDNKKDKIADVRVKKADGAKIQLYCTLDSTDYCPHTAFAAALPQVINATRR